MLSHLPPFRRRSVALALYRMLTADAFCITTVRNALGVAEVAYDRTRFEAVRLHHCARYAEMPPGFHADLAGQTLALFAGRPVVGDGFLRDLATTAGLRPEDAPLVQALVPLATA